MNKRKLYSDGFTLVELLIVIVIIGVLAGISIMAYNGIQSRTQSATIQSDLRNFAQKVEQFYIINDHYPKSSNELLSLGWKISQKQSYQQKSGGNVLYCTISSGSDAKFVIAARTVANKAFTYSSQNGLQEYSGAWTGAGPIDCPLYGISTSATESMYAEGYHPSDWGGPGWKEWAETSN